MWKVLLFFPLDGKRKIMFRVIDLSKVIELVSGKSGI